MLQWIEVWTLNREFEKKKYIADPEKSQSLLTLAVPYNEKQDPCASALNTILG